MAYAGADWTVGNSTNFFGGTSKYADTSGNKATLTFTNSEQIGWITTEGPSRGKAKVSLYEGTTLIASVTRDTYSDPVAYRQLLYSRGSLDPTKTYKLVVEVLHTKNNLSSDYRVDVDSFVVIR